MNKRKLSLLFTVSLTTIGSVFSTDFNLNKELLSKYSKTAQEILASEQASEQPVTFTDIVKNYLSKYASKESFMQARSYLSGYTTKEAVMNGLSKTRASLSNVDAETLRDGKVVLGVTGSLLTIAIAQNIYDYKKALRDCSNLDSLYTEQASEVVPATPEVVPATPEVAPATPEVAPATPVVEKAPEAIRVIPAVKAPVTVAPVVRQAAPVVKQATVAPVVKQAPVVKKPTVDEIVKNCANDVQGLIHALRSNGYTKTHATTASLKQFSKLNDGQAKFVLSKI